jgi:hypothetical protein
MHVQKKKNENGILILDMLNNNFEDVKANLIKENRNLNNIHSQINKGVKILSKIKPLDSKETENNYYTENKDEIKINNLKKNLNDDKEMKAFYRLNIHNYKLWDKQENSKDNLSDENTTIKAILERLEIENKNKIIQEKLKSIELHDCNKRKKIKLKPLKINSYLSHLINKSLSQSKRNILKKMNLDNQIKNVKKNNSSDNNDIKPKNFFLENQNTSYYSSIFKNTTVNIIKNKDGESIYENPCYSPSLGRNLWEEFQTIDNEEYDSIEKSNMIKEGIKDINKVKLKRHFYLSEKKNKSINHNNNNFKKKNKYILNDIRDLTKVKSIKDIEKILFKKKKSSELIINDKFKKIK